MESIHRKVCSSHAFFDLLRASAQTKGPRETTASKLASLSGVVLLNSPAIGGADFEEYLSLWRACREPSSFEGSDGNDDSRGSDLPCCYFFCGDGAYRKLLSYVASQRQGRQHTRCSIGDAGSADSRSSFDVSRAVLCDAVVGDMDSLALGLTYRNRPGHQLNAEQEAGRADDAASGATGGADPLSCVSELAMLRSLDFAGDLYDTVDTIPESVLDRLHARAHSIRSQTAKCIYKSEGNADTDSHTSYSAMLLPVACQLTTDFDKCVHLLGRLKKHFPEDFEEYTITSEQNRTLCDPRHVTEAAATTAMVGASSAPSFPGLLQLVETASLERIAALSEECGGDGGDSTAGDGRDAENPAKRDARRERDLISELSLCTARIVHDTKTASTAALDTAKNDNPLQGTFLMHTHVLPNVAVLGGLGGRFDHEMGAISTLAAFARDFHLMLVNKSNVIFACWPNGVTAWLPMNPRCKPRVQQQHTLGASEMDLMGNHKSDSNPTQPHTRGSAVGKAGDRTPSVRGEGSICGLIPYGLAIEVETTGLVYDIVKGRNDTLTDLSAHHRQRESMEQRSCQLTPRYDGVTQTEKTRFAFGCLVSACNAAEQPLVVIDMRPLYTQVRARGSASAAEHVAAALSGNPATILSCNRL